MIDENSIHIGRNQDHRSPLEVVAHLMLVIWIKLSVNANMKPRIISNELG